MAMSLVRTSRSGKLARDTNGRRTPKTFYRLAKLLFDTLTKNSAHVCLGSETKDSLAATFFSQPVCANFELSRGSPDVAAKAQFASLFE